MVIRLPFLQEMTLLSNYLLVAVRNLLRNRAFTFINLLGLAVGLACCALIVLYVQYDLSFDRHHENADRIYRILRETRSVGSESRFTGRTPGLLAPTLAAEFPEIDAAVRVYPRPLFVEHEGKGFYHLTCLVESGLFNVFDYPLIWGDPTAIVDNPNAIVLTQSAAKKYFGDENPLGRTMTIEDRLFGDEYTVAGVLRDIPANSHFQFDSLIFKVGSNPIARRNWSEWMPNPSHTGVVLTYLLLDEDADPAALERKLPGFIGRHLGTEVPEFLTYHVQPLTDIYLRTRNVDHDAVTYGDISTVYIFTSIAALVLMIACINFVNLSTARSTTRLREVGLRKAVGARRTQLVRQFLGESVLMASLAFVLSLALVQLTLPAFAQFTGKPLESGSGWTTHVVLALLAVVVGLLAGAYPALSLSGFPAIDVFRGAARWGGGGVFRKALVVFQFLLSTVLIVGALVINDQLAYVQNKKLGFNKDQILTLNVFRQDYDLIPRYKSRQTGVSGAPERHSRRGFVESPWTASGRGRP